jgi:hypothetical protein
MANLPSFSRSNRIKFVVVFPPADAATICSNSSKDNGSPQEVKKWRKSERPTEPVLQKWRMFFVLWDGMEWQHIGAIGHLTEIAHFLLILCF